MCPGAQEPGHPHQDRVRTELRLKQHWLLSRLTLTANGPESCSRRRVPKAPGGGQGDYISMDDYGDEDEVLGCFSWFWVGVCWGLLHP